MRHTLLVLGLLIAALPAAAEPPSQEDIDALERDLAGTQLDEQIDPLLPMLMEGLMERCFPADSADANPVVKDDWSERCLTRAVEVAEQILARPEHADHDRALFVAGKASIAVKRTQAGAAHLERFVTEHPGAAEVGLAHYALADLAAAGGDHAAAVPHYRAAVDALSGPAAVQPRYQLAWSHARAGDPRAAVDEMAILLALPDGLDAEPRAKALQDLENWLAELGEASLTLETLRRCEGDRAADAAERVADDRMAAEQWTVADTHYAALIEGWPDDGRASRWQVARVDAALAVDELDAAAAVTMLLDGYTPGSPHASAHRSDAQHRHHAMQVEETARSAIGALHQGRAARGAPTAATLEGLYHRYLEAYPDATKTHDMRMALAALYQEEGRAGDALDAMIEAVEASSGRDRGAQAARIAWESIKPQLPDLGATTPPGPMNLHEHRLLALADTVTAGFPRHGDAATYALAAGRVRVLHGDLDAGLAQLLDVTTRHPTTPEARSAAAAAVHVSYDREDWAQTMAVSDQLLADRKLTAAHPDLGAVLAQARTAARFNQAVIDWEAGDAAGAAKAFEALAKEQPDVADAPMALYYAATALVEAGDTGRAGMVYRRMYTAYPDHEQAPQALEDEAVMRWEKNDFTAAAALLCTLQERYPDHERAAWAVYTAAWLYDQESQFDEAIRCYGLLVATYPAAPESAEAAPRLEELQE